MILGINGPQGCGKSTLARSLEESLAADGIVAVGVSIDDFYRTRAELDGLAESNPQNPYLQQRGYPGTHDVALGAATLDALSSATRSDEVCVPRFDKAAHGGRGDRRPRNAWRIVRGPVDVILFEGWMLGFSAPPTPSSPPSAAGTLIAFRAVERRLREYTPWNDRLDALVQLLVRDHEQIVRWRVEAEAQMRASGRDGMSEDEVRDYVRRFIPAYEVWPAQLRSSPPVAREDHAVAWLDADRTVIDWSGWTPESR